MFHKGRESAAFMNLNDHAEKVKEVHQFMKNIEADDGVGTIVRNEAEQRASDYESAFFLPVTPALHTLKCALAAPGAKTTLESVNLTDNSSDRETGAVLEYRNHTALGGPLVVGRTPLQSSKFVKFDYTTGDFVSESAGFKQRYKHFGFPATGAARWNKNTRRGGKVARVQTYRAGYLGRLLPRRQGQDGADRRYVSKC